MSKKKNGKNSKKNNGFPKRTPSTEFGILINTSSDNTNATDEFEILKPTKAGAEKLGYTKKKSKLTMVSVDNTAEVAKKAPPIQEMSEMLDLMEDFVKAGKFGKAFESLQPNVVDEFIAAYKAMSSSDDTFATMNGMVKKFISICKSFYEYDDKNRDLISDNIYDGLMSHFLSIDGNIEPTGIVPKGSKKLTKVGINYETLHNNMDKCYAVNYRDTIPDGVKEQDCVEGFLHRVYRALGISSSVDIELELSPKIDGVSVNGTIHGDVLLNPQSRGDHNESVAIPGLNGLTVSTGHESEKDYGIQYEMFVTKADVKKASEILGLDKPYVSCRHAASGIMHRLSTEENDKLLECISMYPIATEGLDGTYEERMDYISNFGIVPKDMIPRKVIRGNMRSLPIIISQEFYMLGLKRNSLSYAIDGLVITVRGDENQKSIGRVDRTNKFQIALKFDPANASARVDHIELDTGTKGFRTIQIYLDKPITLEGVEYDHVPVASIPLFNMMKLRKNTKIRVHRVGDVIPSITVEEGGSGPILELPKTCPHCGNPLDVHNQRLYCNNMACSGNLVGKFSLFFEAMGLVGYGDSFSEMLVKQMGCKSIADVIKLQDKDFAEKGITLKLAKGLHKVLVDAIEDHRDYEILGALGLPGVSKIRAKQILAKVKFSDLANQSNEMYRTLATEAVGPNPDKLIDTMTSQEFKDAIKTIEKLDYIVTKDFSKVVRVGHTGGGDTQEVKDLCRKLGYDLVDGKAFDILVTASMDSTSGKMEAAKSKKLPIYVPEDFIKQYSAKLDEATTVKTSSNNTATLFGDDEPIPDQVITTAETRMTNFTKRKMALFTELLANG